MNLHSDYPFWMIKEGIKNTFPTLEADLKTEVLIIGGGISGALIGHKLAKAGLETTVVEKRHMGFGSTSASTALLQYEIDTPLFQLMDMKGDENAVRAYRICAQAIEKIGNICKKIPGRAGFESHPSLFYASSKKHAKDIIEPEFNARKAAGFKVKLLSEEGIAKQFGFSAPAGILSEVGGQVNPLQLTQHLLSKMQKNGARIFDLTEVESWDPGAKKVVLRTTKGHIITAKYVVVACGYESQNYLPKKVTQLNSSYAIVSKPMAAKKNHWYRNSLIWETKTPYLYLRTTSDNRIIVGGRDETFYNPEKRDELLPRKRKELEDDFKKMFPDIPFQTDFAWAGTFGETKDGLPYIGSYNSPRTLFAMGYGGNGITFSVAAADILSDLILRKKNKDSDLFSFER
jgi:glycine/D-amino acid oxidase-like deaminating enzyme